MKKTVLKKEEVISLYALEIGEEIEISYGTTVMRMPAGWIFSSPRGTAFIPYNDQAEKDKWNLLEVIRGKE